MSKLQFFHNDEFGKIRVFLDAEGNPWFIAKDACAALAIEKYRDALTWLDEDERGSVLVDTLGGKQAMATVNKSSLYSLILRSRKPEAQVFKRWVTHEVIPSIRKTGQYAKPQAGQTVTVSVDVGEVIDLLAYVSTLRQMARQKIYPDRMRMEFLAEVYCVNLGVCIVFTATLCRTFC